VPTSPRTSRCLRVLALAPLVLALTAIGFSAPATSGGVTEGATDRTTERRPSPASHLLAPDRMPTPDAAWSETATATDDLSVLGPCHVASLVDIGALTSVRRTWSSPGSTHRATQWVARFADSRSAWRAHQVLVAWRDDCAAEDDRDVTAMRSVSVATGVGNAYRVRQGSRATDVGVLRKGSWISVVAVVGPSSRIPIDSTLARTAVKRIAATF
jgi:hypothetical protein